MVKSRMSLTYLATTKAKEKSHLFGLGTEDKEFQVVVCVCVGTCQHMCGGGT